MIPQALPHADRAARCSLMSGELGAGWHEFPARSIVMMVGSDRRSARLRRCHSSKGRSSSLPCRLNRSLP
jgi:hypothetical protein